MNEVRVAIIFVAVGGLLLYATLSVRSSKKKLRNEVTFFELWNMLGKLSINPGLVLAGKSEEEKEVLLQLNSKLKAGTFITAALVVLINIAADMFMNSL